MNRTISIVLATLLIGSGCSANYKAIHKSSMIEGSQVTYIDAKQTPVVQQVQKDDNGQKRLKVCVGKFPDAISALASAGSLSDGKNLVQLGGSTSESVANIGLRTQLSNAQTEYLYRLCEAEMNGTLSTETMERQFAKFPHSIVAMLAIEQLTGYAQPTTVTLHTNGSTSAGELLAQAQKDLEAARKTEVEKQHSLETRQTAHTEAKQAQNTKEAELKTEQEKTAQDATKVATLEKEAEELKKAAAKKQEEVEIAQKAATEATDNVATQERIREATQSINVTTGSLPSTISVPTQRLDKDSIQHISTAVENIVKTTLHQTTTTDDCLTILQKAKVTDVKNSAVQFCVTHLNEVRKAQIRLAELRILNTSSANPPASTGLGGLHSRFDDGVYFGGNREMLEEIKKLENQGKKQ